MKIQLLTIEKRSFCNLKSRYIPLFVFIEIARKVGLNGNPLYHITVLPQLHVLQLIAEVVS